MKTAIWWIRRDLRLTDNQALQGAQAASDQVIPLFILDPALLRSPWVGEKRLTFLYAALHALDEDLRKIGSCLIVRQGKPIDVLTDLCRTDQVSTIHAEWDYSPFATQRDDAVAAILPFERHPGITIRPLDSVLKEDGEPYTVFTPYAKRWLREFSIRRAEIIPRPKVLPIPQGIHSETLPDIPDLINTLPFVATEQAGQQRLGIFIKGDNATKGDAAATGDDAPIFDYANLRNLPFDDATAHLSPYLRFGLISPRLAALGAYTAIANTMDEKKRQSARTWLNELIWRDFYITILAKFPHVRTGAFRPIYNEINWANHQADFKAWCTGQTGYPFVDAAMRQLATIGWMHNRARMVVASFLVKDLLIDWRWGERWFMQQLVDGDPAANNGGWQWTAGTGTDAAPYFRIFNPIAQSQKFDPHGNYIRRWVPELKTVPDQFIHAPWQLAIAAQKRANCVIGTDYPAPIVDHKWARERTLNAYKAAR